MKKKTICIGIAAAVVSLAAVCGGICAWSIQKANAERNRQNYVASRLLETGEYEQGRILSAQIEQEKPNIVSERLLILAAGFQTEYEIGALYAERYQENKQDPILLSLQEIYQRALEERAETTELTSDFYLTQSERVRQELLPLLLKVQNDISVNKNDSRIQAIVELMSGQGNGTAAAQLESDDSQLAGKAQLSYLIQNNDYIAAYEKAEKLYLESDSLENRVMLANLAVMQKDYLAEDRQALQLQEEQEQVRQELNELEEQYAQETQNTKLNRLIQRMEKLQNRIEDLQREIDAIPAQKAINFMETTTPASEKKATAYQLELAQLHYRAGQEEEARKVLTEIALEERTSREPAELMLSDFLRAFRGGDQSDPFSYGYTGNGIMETLWNRVAQVVGLPEDRNWFGEKTFYQFVLTMLDQLYNGVLIREIDASEYPVVRVTVNVSLDTEHFLTKQNFVLTEMGEVLKEFELLNPENLPVAQEMSVVLVVDRSGSMSGSPLEDTKRAVADFVLATDEKIRIGLVAFDDSAVLIREITDNQSSLIQGVRSLNTGGGTNIYSGLKLAGETLEAESGRKVVILLSDGEDGNAAAIDEVLDEFVRRGVYVYTIGFGGADTDYLSYIARKSGGKFIQADSSRMLSEIYGAVREYMVNDYVLEFRAVTEPENFTRTVNVSIDINNAFSEREYHVGVPYEAIEAEQDKTPLANYYQQIGGSRTE